MNIVCLRQTKSNKLNKKDKMETINVSKLSESELEQFSEIHKKVIPKRKKKFTQKLISISNKKKKKVEIKLV